MKTRLGTEGGQQRVILCTTTGGFYLSVRPARRYYRVGLFIGLLPWDVRGTLGRS